MNNSILALIILGLKFIPFWIMLEMITYCLFNKHTDLLGGLAFYSCFVLYTMKVGLKDED